MIIPISDENTYLGRPIVNYILIGLNVLVFLILNGAIGADRAFPVVAHVPKGFSPLTLITSIFVHAGILHIAGNMLYLWITGDNVEMSLGRGLYASFYVACGIIAGIVHTIVNWGSPVPVVGASGAISGVLGAYLVLCPNNKIRFWYWFYYAWWGTFEVQAKWAIGLYFLLQFIYIALLGDLSNVSYEAHIGGGLAGVGLALLLLHLGWAKRQRPHAWIRIPSTSRRAPRGLAGDGEASPLPPARRERRSPLPHVPRRVHLRARGHQPRGLQVKDPHAWTLIREEEGPIDTYATGQIISEELGCPLLDITSLLSTTKGFLTREIRKDQAERLVPLLDRIGVKALAVPCRDLEELPRAILLRAVRVHANGLDTRTEWEEFSILWDEIRLVSCGRLRMKRMVRKLIGARAEEPMVYPYGGFRIPTGRSVMMEVPREEIVIDLFHTDPRLRFRFWEGRFGMEGIGGATSAERMGALARRIVENARGPFFSEGLATLAEGKDLGRFSFGNRAAFENYNRYLFLLERNDPSLLRRGRGRYLEI